MKQIVMETKLLTNAAKGEYTITTYYSDCTYEERIAPLGPIIIPTYIVPAGSDVESLPEPPGVAEGLLTVGFCVVVLVTLFSALSWLLS